MSIEMNYFLEKYATASKKMNMNTLPYIVSTLKTSLESGYFATNRSSAIDTLSLKGSIPEFKYRRLNDDNLNCIMNSMVGVGFLRMLDLSYNEIGDKSSTAIAKFIKVKFKFNIE